MGQPDINAFYDQLCSRYAWDFGALGNFWFGNATGIVWPGGNPPWSETDFLAIYPKFAGIVPDAVINIYIGLARASVMQEQWQEMWPIAMGWFVAHFVTLWLQSEGSPANTAGQVASSGLAIGIQTSMSAGPVSVGMTLLGNLDDWGTWALTLYGQQFATMAKTMGTGPIFIS
jgi:hypothetical protein